MLLFLLFLTSIGYYLGRKKSFLISEPIGGIKHLHSRPVYYGTLTALWCAIPAFIIFVIWLGFEDHIIAGLVVGNLPDQIQNLAPDQLNLVINDIKNIVYGNIVSNDPSLVIKKAAADYKVLKETSINTLSCLALTISIIAMAWGYKKIQPSFRARNQVETVVKYLLIACSTVAIFTTIGIVMSVLYEAIKFFKAVSVLEFLFGLEWSPQMAIREDQVGSSGAFGAIPVFTGTLLISAIAMAVSIPVGLMSAIYLSEYASKRVRDIIKPLLEILAGIPTVVYGFFAALTVAPFIRDVGNMLWMDVSSESALAAGLVMGIMIIPFISSLSDDVINAVPQSLRDASYGLGATKSETIKNVVIPAALPGIVGSILLAISRAIGETMIVVMAAGMAANLTANPLKTVTTVTVQIVTLLVGDQEFDSPKTLAAFALGLLLFVVTLILNIIALVVVRKYREQYD